MKNYCLFLLAFIMFNVPVCVMSEEKPAQTASSPERLAKRVVVEGKVACVGCSLKALDPEVDSQCTLFAKHAQGLVAADGTIFSFLDNGRGHILLSDPKWKGKELKILGWKLPKTQIVEVSKFQLKEGDKWVAYDYCKSCGFEPGDNKDKGTCEGCGEH